MAAAAAAARSADDVAGWPADGDSTLRMHVCLCVPGVNEHWKKNYTLHRLRRLRGSTHAHAARWLLARSAAGAHASASSSGCMLRTYQSAAAATAGRSTTPPYLQAQARVCARVCVCGEGFRGRLGV
jgi:hypothetical protein